MSNALLVVDVQQYFLSNAPAELPERIVNHYESVGYDHIIFCTFKNKLGSNFERLLKWGQCKTEADMKLPHEFNEYIASGNVINREGTYSAFKGSELDTHLRKLNVERLVICGIDTDACVLATAFEAFDLGYHVKIEFGLCYSSNELHEAAILIAQRNLFSRD